MPLRKTFMRRAICVSSVVSQGGNRPLSPKRSRWCSLKPVPLRQTAAQAEVSDRCVMACRGAAVSRTCVTAVPGGERHAK